MSTATRKISLTLHGKSVGSVNENVFDFTKNKLAEGYRPAHLVQALIRSGREPHTARCIVNNARRQEAS